MKEASTAATSTSSDMEMTESSIENASDVAPAQEITSLPTMPHTYWLASAEEAGRSEGLQMLLAALQSSAPRAPAASRLPFAPSVESAITHVSSASRYDNPGQPQ